MSPHDSLARAVEHVLAGFQQDFPVVDDGRLVGIVTPDNVTEFVMIHEALRGGQPRRMAA